MTSRDEDAPRVVIRDKRRIDPISGTVRVPDLNVAPVCWPGTAGAE